jgi:NodT family efflux transporter outer membrane factor (OMF) lipoprotein
MGRRFAASLASAVCRPLLSALAGLWLAGCTVGPDFATPQTEIAAAWMEAADPRVSAGEPVDQLWWKTFNDPLLDRLIELAYANNPTIEAAGVSVLQARAALGIATGDLYPQQQVIGADGSIQRNADPTGTPLPFVTDAFRTVRFGASTSWEIDLWGKFRRAIESADSDLIAAISAYDDALVTLVADVATVYVNIRVLEERIAIADENVRSQRGSLGIANSRFNNGETSELDVAQARSTLAESEAQIPLLQSELGQAKYSLALLLGLPPDQVDELLAPGEIPTAPQTVAVGIPTDLLRRRPDVREAEYEAAAQSALVGVAEANLYPAFSLSGTFGFASTDRGQVSLSDVAKWSSRTYSFGPTISLPIFNYGQLTNQVRQQDAALQAAILRYQFTVLQAQQEVESGLVGFLQGQEVVEKYRLAVRAARRTTGLSITQYRDGATDYSDVLDAQQSQLRLEDALAQAEGAVPLNLISVYRALGGGWELRAGNDFVSDETKKEMGERTDWGDLLEPAEHDAPTPEEQKDLIRAPDW